ncbi:ankyrin repeat domain-containing protein [Pseudokordiimonas caeni]|uniref:ankyrin repeat domain-containing protein n=1 Tax=Pseudokordiimonas caeni TaxID=2997908 RepID=UPI00281239EE|nr:ankyrin repeat domain-containing protein [Pseudokordiimonas caeni]
MKILARLGLVLFMSLFAANQAAHAMSDQFELLKAVESNDIAKLTELLNKGVSPNTRQRTSGQPAILIAARKGNMVIMKMLLDHQANPDMTDRGGSETALMVRATTGDAEGIKMLLDAGADINRTDASLETALTKAVRNRQFRAAQILIANNANPNVQDVTGKSALDYAKERRNSRMIRLLEDAGAR